MYGKNNIGIPTSSITFNLQVPFNLDPVCYIRIVFPSDIKLNLNAKADNYVGSGIASTPTSIPLEVLQYLNPSNGVDNNELTIEGCRDNPSLTSSRSGTITINNIVSPGQLKDTGNFLI
jgi:hypothetical protein